MKRYLLSLLLCLSCLAGQEPWKQDTQWMKNDLAIKQLQDRIDLERKIQKVITNSGDITKAVKSKPYLDAQKIIEACGEKMTKLLYDQQRIRDEYLKNR